MQAGFATIGLTGVDCWHRKKSSSLLPDLERIELKGRKVFIAFDSDAATNSNVRENESLLADADKARRRGQGPTLPPRPRRRKSGVRRLPCCARDARTLPTD